MDEVLLTLIVYLATPSQALSFLKVWPPCPEMRQVVLRLPAEQSFGFDVRVLSMWQVRENVEAFAR